jgi:hypothetical protein
MDLSTVKINLLLNLINNILIINLHEITFVPLARTVLDS